MNAAGKSNTVYFAMSWMCALLMILLVIFYWNQLPETIPTHFNGLGEPDGYGRKCTLFLLIIIGLGLTGMMQYFHGNKELWQIKAHRQGANNEQKLTLTREMLAQLTLLVAAVFLYIVYGSIQVALENWEGLGTYFLFLFLGLTAGVLVIYFIRLYRSM
ncbi:DUF1648 domain-containing protein [Croceiramulus getboli]|nr:DUF1648 domain-containing protein [Flavobacteriaceae bacterium YJPT1-3]